MFGVCPTPKARKREQGRAHPRFIAELYTLQLHTAPYVLHERASLASSWVDASTADLLERSKVTTEHESADRFHAPKSLEPNAAKGAWPSSIKSKSVHHIMHANNASVHNKKRVSVRICTNLNMDYCHS